VDGARKRDILFASPALEPERERLWDYIQDHLWRTPRFILENEPIRRFNRSANRPDLSWTASAGATSYEYCIDKTDNDLCDSDNWVSTGTNLSAKPPDLANSTTYYWQVRAKNTHGETYADNGNWWNFTTQAPLPPPEPFNKINPQDEAIDQPINLT